MPHVDKKTGEIVIRVVYDGIPEAGKTTNVKGLTSMVALQRRGATGSPGTGNPRTEFFDWLDFSGGFVAGKRVRCQLVSVPGQTQLLHRRRYLLESADAVVFVADARPDRLDDTRASLHATRRMLERLSPDNPVAIVVQANKQDLPGALDPLALAAALELSATTLILPAVASEGRGLMDTFIVATRLAIDRVRALLSELELPELAVDETPAALHAAMLRLEGSTHRAEPARANACPAELRAAFGPSIELSAGHVWPPVRGRMLLAELARRELTVPAERAPWATADVWELCSRGWTLHTHSTWGFDDEASARTALLALVRRQLRWGELLFEGRVVFIAPHAGGFRIWMLTTSVEPLAEHLERLIGTGDLARAGRALRALHMVTARLLADGPRLPIGALAFHDGRPVVLEIVEEGESSDAPPLAAQLSECLAAIDAREPLLREHGAREVE